ncbi:MAG TPA: hypothetical protein VKZ58_05790 [Longimicrobiales bacterium]|nr:hypothetical protein [Longimicrobiales bacterium]
MPSIPREEAIGLDERMAADQEIRNDPVPSATPTTVLTPRGARGESGIDRHRGQPYIDPFHRFAGRFRRGEDGAHLAPDHVARHEFAFRSARPQRRE